MTSIILPAEGGGAAYRQYAPRLESTLINTESLILIRQEISEPWLQDQPAPVPLSGECVALAIKSVRHGVSCCQACCQPSRTAE